MHADSGKKKAIWGKFKPNTLDKIRKDPPRVRKLFEEADDFQRQYADFRTAVPAFETRFSTEVENMNRIMGGIYDCRDVLKPTLEAIDIGITKTSRDKGFDLGEQRFEAFEQALIYNHKLASLYVKDLKSFLKQGKTTLAEVEKKLENGGD